jgi:hypothetical protein
MLGQARAWGLNHHQCFEALESICLALELSKSDALTRTDFGPQARRHGGNQALLPAVQRPPSTLEPLGSNPG